MPAHVSEREMRRILSLTPAEIFSAAMHMAREFIEDSMDEGDEPALVFDDWSRERCSQAVAAAVVMREESRKAAA